MVAFLKKISLCLIIIYAQNLFSQADLPEFKRIPTDGILWTGNALQAVKANNEAIHLGSGNAIISKLGVSIKYFEFNLNYYNRSLAYLIEKQVDRSIEDALNCLRQKDCPKEIYIILGQASFLRSNHKQSIDYYLKAGNLISRNYTAYYNMANSYFELMEYDAAEDAAMRAKSIHHTKEIDQLVQTFDDRKSKDRERIETKLGDRSQKYHVSQTNLKNQKRVLKGTGLPVTGVVFDRYENGNYKFISNYSEGLKYGSSIEHFDRPDEPEKIKSNYKNGILDGKYEEYWSNLKPKLTCTYKNGKPIGEYRQFDEDTGKPVIEAIYRSDGVLREEKVIDKNGVVVSTKRLNPEDGFYEVTEKRSNGDIITIKSESSSGQVRNLVEHQYYEPGKVKTKNRYSYTCPEKYGSKTLDGISLENYPNGKLKVMRIYRCGELVQEVFE